MGLLEDIETMERHSKKGTLKEWFTGTAKPIPKEKRLPIDPSASRKPKSTYLFSKIRGD